MQQSGFSKLVFRIYRHSAILSRSCNNQDCPSKCSEYTNILSQSITVRIVQVSVRNIQTFCNSQLQSGLAKLVFGIYKHSITVNYSYQLGQFYAGKWKGVPDSEARRKRGWQRTCYLRVQRQHILLGMYENSKYAQNPQYKNIFAITLVHEICASLISCAL